MAMPSSKYLLIINYLFFCCLIGAKKCGTRFLIQSLRLHPKVRISNEEIHFFDHDTEAKGLEWYRQRYLRLKCTEIVLGYCENFLTECQSPRLMR